MIAKNYCLMRIRDQGGKKTAEIKEDSLSAYDETGNLKHHQEKDLKLELMEESLNELNGEQKHCVTLFYLEKRSYQEISDLTGYTLMQVKSYIQNGKRNLRLLVEKKLNDSGIRQ